MNKKTTPNTDSVTSRYEHLKEIYDNKTYVLEDFDKLSRELLGRLGHMSSLGTKRIDGFDINLWKDRVWFLVEKTGLLPEYKDTDDTEYKEQKDEWYTSESESFPEEEIGEPDDISILEASRTLC